MKNRERYRARAPKKVARTLYRSLSQDAIYFRKGSQRSTPMRRRSEISSVDTRT